MAEKINEQLSALVDGEYQQTEWDLLFRRVANDVELRDRWERYNLISDVLRQHLPDAVPGGFSQRVMAAIEADGSVEVSTVVEETTPSRPAAWLKPVVGFALAASVASVAVLSFDADQLSRSAGPSLAEINSNTEVSAPTTLLPVPENLDLDQRMSAYLVNHSEYVSMNGVNGVIPYVRMVGYQANH